MTEAQRKVYTYRHMLMVAERMSAQAKENNERDNSIATIVFCAFALEGYLNHAGEELIPRWNDRFEKLKPKAKLIMLTDHYRVNIEFGTLPFQAFSTIFAVRNQLAHPKTKKHNYVEKKGKIWLKVGTTKWPAERWENLCKAEYSENFVENTQAMIKFLDNALPLKKIPNFLVSENVLGI